MEKRSEITEQELTDKSNAICSRLFENEYCRQASIIMCYMDFRNEVRTGVFLRECLKRKKRIALPVVRNLDGERELIPFEINDLDRDLHPGAYGILEPSAEITQPVKEGDIDIAVVPGVAFDLRKHRLGYGAGYYDRFLRRLKPSCKRIGIAFEMQIVDEIPVEAHDIAMDFIVTESRIII